MQYSARRGPQIAPVFEPRSVALVGASERPGSLGTVLFGNLVDAGFRGAVHAVNPRYRSVRGQPCVASLRDLEGPVDLAVIVAPARAVPGILEDCGACGVPAAIILSAGFRETGEAGEALERAVLATARRCGIRFIGPNCLGIMRPAAALNATFSQCMAKPGQIALVSQSGAMCTAMLDWALPRGVGFSCVVSTGIAADVGFGEILDYLVADPETRAIMLYVEGVHDARRFMSALRAASRAKPVIVMKAGRYAEGRKAVASHTGALVGSDDVFDAALKRAGVVRVRDYSSFFAIAETLNTGVRSKGPRLAVVTNGGGPGVMAADFMIDRHLRLAELSESTRRKLDSLLSIDWSGGNPVDVLGDATAGEYSGAVSACLADESVDGVLAILVPTAMTDPDAIAKAVPAMGRGGGKPVFTCWMGESSVASSRRHFREQGVPTFATPEEAVEAFTAIEAHRANQELLLQVPEPAGRAAAPDRGLAASIVAGAVAEGRTVLDLVESRALLAAFRIPVVAGRSARTADEAAAMAEETGFPVAMKIHSPDITHKSDVGGVRLGLRSAGEVRANYRGLVDDVCRLHPAAEIRGVLIEPMWSSPNGRELMLGVLGDELFGPVISVGLGGTLVEVIRDRSIGLPPLNRRLARRMLADTRANRVLEEFRGKPAANRRAVEDVLMRLSEMVCELPEIQELDINPLVVDDREAIALDARVVVRGADPAQRRYAHLAIHPYPGELVAEHRLADGRRLLIRPIRPEDAGLEREFIDGLSDRSRYLRFMNTIKGATPQMVSRFTQIDYDREMALIALANEDGSDRQVAVARYVTNPDGKTCEFAIAVADRWQNHGIATELLRRLVAVARDRRLEVMEGVVLRENRRMLELADDLGFERQRLPDDNSAVVISLRL